MSISESNTDTRDASTSEPIGTMSRAWVAAALSCVAVFAVAIQWTSWQVTDCVARDSIGFIMRAAEFSSQSLRDTVQEPVHPFVLHLLNRIVSPTGNSSIQDHASWELTLFLDGLIFTLSASAFLYLIARRLHSAAAGVWAAVFFVVMSYTTEYAIAGLSELPYLAFLLAAIYCVIRSNDSHRASFLVAAGGLAAILLLTRKEGFILIPLVVAYLFLQHRTARKDAIRCIAAFAIGVGVSLVAYYAIGGRFFWFEEYAGVLKKLAGRRFGALTCVDAGRFILADYWIRKNHEYLVVPLFGMFKLCGFVPAILLAVYLFCRRSFPLRSGSAIVFLYAAAHIVLVCAQMTVTRCFVSRYMFAACVVLFPVCAVVMTYLMHRLSERLKLPSPSMVAAVTMAVMTLAFSAETIQNAFSNRRPEIHSAAEWLTRHAASGERVIVSDVRIGFYSGHPWTSLAFREPLADIAKVLQKHRSGLFALTYRTTIQKRFHDRIRHQINKRGLTIQAMQILPSRKTETLLLRLGTRTAEPATTPPKQSPASHR